jgi:hypothetical protein
MFVNCCKGYCSQKMLNDPAQSGFENVDRLGFAIRRPRERQFHVGLLYRSGTKSKLRHHCEHNDLRDEDAGNPEYLWTDIAALSAVNKKLIANRMSRAGGDKVPYGVGFRAGRKYLDPKTLKYVSTNPGDGLTCATYIVAAMETLGFVPLDMSDWPETTEDTAWQARMVQAQAEKFPKDKEHFEAEKANVGGPRVRPEHVVATAYPKTWPITHAEATEIGAKVIACYDKKRPPILPGIIGL